MTLPDDVLAWLRSIHSDPAWAIVLLCERAGKSGRHVRPVAPASPSLVGLPRRRALIVVDPAALRNVEHVTTIPLADGRAFLTLRPHQGVADLELAIADRLEAIPRTGLEHEQLSVLRAQIREWRRTPGLTFRSRAIIVVEGAVPEPAGARALGRLGGKRPRR
jgi:hypothetical protein